MKIIIRRVLNLLLYLSVCALTGTGLLMAFRLPPGSRGGQRLEVLGWNRHDWGDLHTWVSYLFLALVVIHLAMNWAWLAKVAAKGQLWRVVVGLLLGLTIIAAFLLLPVQERERGKKHERTPRARAAVPSSLLIGSFTFGGIASRDATGQVN